MFALLASNEKPPLPSGKPAAYLVARHNGVYGDILGVATRRACCAVADFLRAKMDDFVCATLRTPELVLQGCVAVMFLLAFTQSTDPPSTPHIAYTHRRRLSPTSIATSNKATSDVGTDVDVLDKQTNPCILQTRQQLFRSFPVAFAHVYARGR